MDSIESVGMSRSKQASAALPHSLGSHARTHTQTHSRYTRGRV